MANDIYFRMEGTREIREGVTWEGRTTIEQVFAYMVNNGLYTQDGVVQLEKLSPEAFNHVLLEMYSDGEIYLDIFTTDFYDCLNEDIEYIMEVQFPDTVSGDALNFTDFQPNKDAWIDAVACGQTEEGFNEWMQQQLKTVRSNWT